MCFTDLFCYSVYVSASASAMTGFLLTMYVEETGYTNSFGPSICYIVDSKTVILCALCL